MMMLSRVANRRVASLARRGFATRLKSKDINRIAPEVLDALPVYTQPSDETPRHDRSPVTSAHCIDVESNQVSYTDSAAINPNGKVVHGTFGELAQEAATIPLEYLALLRFAAEGCAALRVTLKTSSQGTLLVYGAGQASGMAVAQIASAAGHAVVAVVDSSQSGNELFLTSLTGLLAEPSAAVPEEYALSKGRFANLVAGIATGDDGTSRAASAEVYLEDFKKNFVDQCIMYPDTRAAAVSEKHMEFKYMEKDRDFWEQNMEAYLEQFPEGAPSVDQAKLDAGFTVEQYDIFKQKFWHQTTAVISGDDKPFSAPHLVQDQIRSPETADTKKGEMPYAFSVLDQYFPPGTEATPGGPVLGAIVCVTPDLKIAAERVAAATTLRGKAEALQFLTHTQRAAFSAACSVVAQAAGAPVTVIGGTLPGLSSPPVVTEADVQAALEAMDVQEDGSTALNYFVQTYRAADFPFYADYAVHRASEELAGPRQIIVTK
jgi:hypothetical protein